MHSGKQAKNKANALGDFLVWFRFFLVLSGIFLVAASMVFAQSSCGNSQCDTGENSCNCPKDCGMCSGSVPNTFCKEFACVENICKPTLVSNCCGNDSCEQGEYFGNCPADCSPTSLELEVLSPAQNQLFFLGEPVLVKVKATSSGSSAAIADLNVTGFFGVLKLFNDGKHGDDLLFDPVFGNHFVVTDVNDGFFDLNVNGRFYGISAMQPISIQVQTRLAAELEIKPKARRGDRITATGHILKRTAPVSMPLTIQLWSGKQKIFESLTTSDADGFFTFEYQSSLIDRLGEWKILVFGADEFQNSVLAEKKFVMREENAPAELFVHIINEVPALLRRGDELELFVEVRDDQNITVENAQVFLELLTKRIPFQMTGNGRYAINTLISSNLPIGKQVFRIVATKKDANNSAEGEFLLIQEIGSAQLQVKLLEPTDLYYRVGDKIPVLIKVNYADQAPVVGANVRLRIQDEEWVLEPIEEGLYKTEVLLEEKHRGELSIFLKVNDELGNEAIAQKEITVAQGTALSSLLENPVLTLVILLGLAGIGFFGFRSFSTVFSRYDLEEKRKELIKQKELLEKSYFEKASLDKEAYEKRFRENKDALDRVEEARRKLRR